MAKTVTNNSGGALSDGDVLIWDTSADNALTTTTTAGNRLVAGVSIGAVAASGNVNLVGNGLVETVNVTGAVSRGDYLKTSTTAGKAQATTTYDVGVFAIAVTSAAGPGAGTVSAWIVNVSPNTSIGETPVTQAFGDTATAGTSTTAAAGDHKHGMPSHSHAGTPTTQAFGDSATEGSSANAAKTDHKHGMPSDPSLSSKVITGTRASSASGGTEAITGVGFQPTSAIIRLVPTDAAAALSWSEGYVDSSRDIVSVTHRIDVATDYEFTHQTVLEAYDDVSNTNGWQLSVSSYDADGATLSWTVKGSKANVRYEIIFKK